MSRPLNRVAPQLPVGAMQTYQAVATSDQMVVVACATADCQAWRYGWETKVDETTDLGKRQADYIRRESGRTFAELKAGDGLTVFRFEPWQRCFADHRTRPARYLVRRGDWRGDLGTTREHVDVGDWVEDFAEHQDDLADRLRKG